MNRKLDPLTFAVKDRFGCYEQQLQPSYLGRCGSRRLFCHGSGGYALTATLLISVKAFHGSVHVDMDFSIFKIGLLPETLAQRTCSVEYRAGLIDSQAIHIPPEGARRRQTAHLKNPACHCIQTNIDKMPQPIEP